MLTSSPKISYLTNNDFFQLKLPQNDEKVGQSYFSADFSSFRDSLRRSLPKCFQKQDLLCIEVDMSLGVNNFGNSGAMKLIFFSKCFKFNANSINEKKKCSKSLQFFR